MRRAWFGFLLLAGCARPPDLVPFDVGTTWTYTVRSGFDTFVEPVSVVRQVPVAGVKGVELGGPLGISRLGWRDGVLYTDSATNARFQPPISLLASDSKPRHWSGAMESMGKSQKCTADLKHEKVKLQLAGKTIDAVLSTLTIRTPRTTIDLKTWFQSRVGIVQQEQRTGGKLDVAIQLLRGPS